MFSAFNKLTFLAGKKIKKKLVIIYFITIIGTFLETIGIGIILPILKIIVEGKDILIQFSSNYFFINSISSYLITKSYSEIIIILLLFLSFIFFVKTAFFIFLIREQQKFSYMVEYELTKYFFNYYLHQDYSQALSSRKQKNLQIDLSLSSRNRRN